MGLKKRFGIAIFIALATLFPIRADAASLSDVSKQLVCQCGCTQILDSCNHISCMVRDVMNAAISQQLSEGQSEAQITQFFVDRYGEQVLAALPKRGFNLVAWLLPFAVILVGGGAIYFAIRRWVRRDGQPPVSVNAETTVEDEEYQRQLEKELEEFVGSGFR
jgi:cytochrome c-type biogenesis protein CcmH